MQLVQQEELDVYLIVINLCVHLRTDTQLLLETFKHVWNNLGM